MPGPARCPSRSPPRAANGSPRTVRPTPDYREARTTITLGKGEARDVVISCPFEPDRIVVDPDAKVLQLQRKNAVTKF